jgi:hypothetical protein
MLIKTIIFSFLGLIGLANLPMHAFGEKSLFFGSIFFPSTLEMVPSIRVYYAGRKIVCETDDCGKKITFSIPEHKQRTFFFMLITPEIEFCSHENTVPFLKLKKSAPYKFFVMELIQVEAPKKKKKPWSNPFEKNMEYTWSIRQLDLQLPDSRIPDETVIVQYHPDYVQALEGGNNIEFPKIIIKPDILKLVGSEAKLHELSNRWFLAALNTDTIHETAPAEIRITPQSKTILAMAA